MHSLESPFCHPVRPPLKILFRGAALRSGFLRRSMTSADSADTLSPKGFMLCLVAKKSAAGWARLLSIQLIHTPHDLAELGGQLTNNAFRHIPRSVIE